MLPGEIVHDGTPLRHGLISVHGWWWVYVRCWYCDLRIRVGNRRRVRTMGQAFALAERWLP